MTGISDRESTIWSAIDKGELRRLAKRGKRKIFFCAAAAGVVALWSVWCALSPGVAPYDPLAHWVLAGVLAAWAAFHVPFWLDGLRRIHAEIARRTDCASARRCSDTHEGPA